MKDLTFEAETPDMMHPVSPQDEGRIAGEGRPDMKLQDCWAKPAPENRLHFKLLGEVTGNDGLLNFAVNVPLDQLVSNLAEYCKLPKLVVAYLEKEHTPVGKATARWRGDRHTNKVPSDPNDPPVLPGESGELKYIYHTLARRCKLLIDETNDIYNLLLGPLNHNHQIEERWTNSESPGGQTAEAYHRRYTSFPERPLSPQETEPITGPKCEGNNPVGDPFKIKTWERIFAEKIPYSSTWMPYKANEEGKCKLDGDMWKQIEALSASMTKRYKAWFDEKGEDWEERRKRAKVKRGRRRRRSSAWYFSNHLAQSAERIKRFVVALFFAVVAIGSLLFSATQMDSMAARANHNRDETVRLFNKDEHALRVHDEAIRSMNESISALNQAVNADFGHIETLQLTLKTYVAMDSYFSEHSRILRGLSSLFQHRLSPELIHSKAVVATIKEQQEKFSRMGYQVGLESLEDIFRAPTSWITYGNATLFVATHIPVYRTSTRFKLLQPDKTMYFAPPPPPEGSAESAEPRDNYAFTVEGEADLLAVSQDGRYYQTINWSQLTECSKVGALYVCPNSNVLQKTETELTSCLVALYKGKLDHIRKLCRHRSVKRANYALQISGNRFLVRVDTPTTVRFKCSGEERDPKAHVKAEWINDTALVQVAGMCSAVCGDFVLNGRLEFAVQTTAYESQSLNVKDLFPQLIADNDQWEWEKFRKFRATFNPDGVPFEDVGKRFMKFEDDSTEAWIDSIITWCIIGAIAVLSVLAVIRWGPKVRDQWRSYSKKQEARRLGRNPPVPREQTPAPSRRGSFSYGAATGGEPDVELDLLGAYDKMAGAAARQPVDPGAATGVAYQRQPPYRPVDSESVSNIDKEIKRQQKKNMLAKLRLEEASLQKASDPGYRDTVNRVLASGSVPRSKSFSDPNSSAPPAGATLSASASQGVLSGESGSPETGLSKSSHFRSERLSTLAFAVSSPSLEALLTSNPDLRLLRFSDDDEGLKRGWPIVMAACKAGQPLYGMCREEVQAALAELIEDSDHNITQRQAMKMVIDSRERAKKKDETFLVLTKLYDVIKQTPFPRARIDALMFPSRHSLNTK